jgi:glycosyl transferase, family 25
MHTLRPPAPASRQPDAPSGPISRALPELLRHVPTMDLAFDGDSAQANGTDLPIVAINLDRRPDKWQTMCRRMSAVGLTKIVRAPAIEGAQVPASQVAPLLRSQADATDGGPRSHMTLTPPAVGCFLSHLAVWRWMLAAGLPRLLVLEDDAEPVAPFSAERLRTVLAGIPAEMGPVLLGYRSMAGLADRPQRVPEGGAALARIYYFNGTHAYLITPAACEALLGLLLPFYAHLDHQISSVLMEQRGAFAAYYAAPPFFDSDWALGSDVHVPMSDEAGANQELGEIITARRRTLLAEGRPLLSEMNE